MFEEGFTLEDAKRIIVQQQKEIWRYEHAIKAYTLIKHNQEKMSLQFMIEKLEEEIKSEKTSVTLSHEDIYQIQEWLKELNNNRVNKSAVKFIKNDLMKEKRNGHEKL